MFMGESPGSPRPLPPHGPGWPMRVAYYSPLPPSRSGIADYSALLLPALAKRVDVDGYLAALERDAGLVGRLLGHAVVDDRIKPLWEPRSQDFPPARAVLD